jgi:TatD DNase family protein
LNLRHDFYDTHAHLIFQTSPMNYGNSRSARASGIKRVICIGTDLESSRRSIRLAEEFCAVYAAVGWHPSHASAAPNDVRPALRELARHPKVVAIGETGLDYHHLPSKNPTCAAVDDENYKLKQARLFQQHLEIGAELGLNCVIHQRDSFEATWAELEPVARSVRGVFHCFVGNRAELQRVVELGSLVSFTGILTFKNAQSVRESLGATPADRFMLETDCPYLAPIPYRGKRCEPAYVREIASVAAHVRNCSVVKQRITCETAHRFFRKCRGNKPALDQSTFISGRSDRGG